MIQNPAERFANVLSPADQNILAEVRNAATQKRLFAASSNYHSSANLQLRSRSTKRCSGRQRRPSVGERLRRCLHLLAAHSAVSDARWCHLTPLTLQLPSLVARRPPPFGFNRDAATSGTTWHRADCVSATKAVFFFLPVTQESVQALSLLSPWQLGSSSAHEDWVAFAFVFEPHFFFFFHFEVFIFSTCTLQVASVIT